MNKPVTFSWPVRVYWEDTDGGGVVYHARYLNFFERARTEWLRSRGIDQSVLRDEHNRVFVVRKMTVEYLRAARLDDQLVVSVTPIRIARASMEMEQSIERVTAADSAQSEPIARAVVYAACLDAAAFRPVRIPPFILTELQ